ncbi:MAG: DUF2240 family protein, partial [Methanospirillum sp.]|nr:DUF2240 family protein [Methanospirillum sp.]
LIYYYMYDRKWMDREEVDLLIHRGLEQQLLGTDGEMYFPLFDLTDVHIPIGYKPSSSVFNVDNPFEQLLDRITAQSGKEPGEIIGEMNRIISENFDGNLRPEAALVLVAKQNNVRVSDLLAPLKEAFLKKE